MLGKEKIFSDKWIMIVGIPAIGISFPFIFGLRFSDPKFFGWMFISLSTTLISWLSTRQITAFIWLKFPWEKDPMLHILINLILIVLFTLLTIGMIYGLNILLLERGPEYWREMRPIRTGVFLIVTFLSLLHEAIHLFFKWKKELTRAADLEKETMRSKFDALKNHLNPHFLFNSLGTLASLIRTDPAQAERYVGEFSSIYRYFLEVSNNDLVTVGEELDFISSYIFLQQIRFGKGFSFHNNVEPAIRNTFILPLTLELLVENAFKHNATTPGSPLSIEVFAREDRKTLVVRNTYQPRHVKGTTGMGLKNLEQRYLSYLGMPVSYGIEGKYYIAEVPLIYRES